MDTFEVTRLGDYDLSQKYFDALDYFGPDNEDVKIMECELEGRDVIFEGFFIYNRPPLFTVAGCKQDFTVLEDLKDYILTQEGIEPTEDGSMYYVE